MVLEIDYLVKSTTPELSIVGPTTVNEGDNLVYTINSSAPTNVDLTIPVNVRDLPTRITAGGGDFLVDGIHEIHLPAGELTASLTVPTVSDTTPEQDGLIVADVQASPTSAYILKTGAFTVISDVVDDDNDFVPHVIVNNKTLGQSITSVVER